MPCKKCALNFEKRHCKGSYKNGFFKNHFPCRLVPSMSMKLGTFFLVVFFVIRNKSRKDLLEYFWRFCNSNFEKWKNTKKVASFPCQGRKTCEFIPGTLCQTWNMTKRVSSFRCFAVNFIKRLPCKRWPLKNFDFSFGYVFPSSMTVQGFVTIKWQKKKLSAISIFKFLFLTTLPISPPAPSTFPACDMFLHDCIGAAVLVDNSVSIAFFINMSQWKIFPLVCLVITERWNKQL